MSVHTCSYYCERPECVRAQRDELRQKLEQAEGAVAAEREACAKVCEEGTGEPLSYTALKICLRERNRIANAIRARGKK